MGVLLPLLLGDFALVRHVCLVTDENDDDVVAAFAARVIGPFAVLVEGFGVCCPS